MKAMTRTAAACGLLAILCLIGAGTGCDSRDACERYVDDFYAKATACGAYSLSPDEDNWMKDEYVFLCHARPPGYGDCIDACVELLDCGCTFKSSQSSDCAAKQKPAHDCATPCMAMK
jgi:hypothetical protein